MGQGAAMAIEDAVGIATLLPRGTLPQSLPARLELYQQSRRPRVEKVLRFTRMNGRDENDITGARISRTFPVGQGIVEIASNWDIAADMVEFMGICFSI